MRSRIASGSLKIGSALIIGRCTICVGPSSPAWPKLGVQPIVLGAVINHVSVTRAGITLGVYQQYDYEREKAEALRLWADRLAGIVGAGAKVLPMQRGRPA